MRIPKKVNIKDVARESNFSISTVSRVLNGKAEEFRISREAQEIIIKTARQLNYHPNFSASKLKTGKSHTIALSIPSLVNPFFATLSSEINACLRQEGYITILSETNENLSEEISILNGLLKRDIDGLILVPSSTDYHHILELLEYEFPIVCVDRYYEPLSIPYITTNNYKGSELATKYLVDCRHTNILCIQGVPDSIPNKERIRGFTDTLQANGISKIQITGNDFSVQNGYLETKLALQRKNIPTALFALSNTIALGSLKAIREEKLNIPEDISLIAFDDNAYLDYLLSPLTCIAQPMSDIASLSVKFLMALLNKEPLETSQVQLTPTLIKRKSVKKLIS